MNVSHSRSSKRTLTQWLHLLATGGRPPLLKFSAIECLIQRFHFHSALGNAVWIMGNATSEHSQPCKVVLRSVPQNLYRDCKDTLLCTRVHQILMRINEIRKSKPAWLSIPQLSLVRPPYGGWLSVEAWHKDSKKFRDCQMRNVLWKNLLIGNVKVFAGNKWADLPNYAKLCQVIDAQNIESFSCL